MSNPGKIFMTNGLKIQWGNITTDSSGVATVEPYVIQTSVSYNVNLTINRNGSSSGRTCGVKSKSTSSFVIDTAQANEKVDWFVIGY